MKNKTESLFLNEITGTCEVCSENTAKYRCPNCGIVYCSSDCFKKHNNHCISKFSNQLIKDYPPPKVSNETKLKTRKLLAQYDESKVEDAFNTNFNNNSKDELICIENGETIAEENFPIKKLLPQTEVEPWKAWWEKKVIANFPEPTTKPPSQFSPNLVYHLADILYSYCYTMRLYNGDVSFDFDGACNVMVSISSVLGLNVGEIPSVRYALNQCVNNAKDPEIFVEFQWMIEVVSDVELCLQSKSHVYRALSEAHSIAKEAKYKRVFKKLEFFFAWSQTLTVKTLEKLSDEVHDYYTSLQALLFDVRE